MVIHGAVERSSSILELGSGPGRLTRVLVALGHSVTAVDDSEEMLRHVTGAETVCADLFHLEIDRRFDVVLAASHLINRPGEENQLSLLRVCRRHVDAGGIVLVERYPPGWILTAQSGENQVGPVQVTFEAGPLENGIRSASMTYRLANQNWRQDFETADVDDAVLDAVAGRAGLHLEGSLDADATWVKLVAI